MFSSHRISVPIVAKGFPFLPVDFEHVAGLMNRNRSLLHVEPAEEGTVVQSGWPRKHHTYTKQKREKSRMTGYNQQCWHDKKKPMEEGQDEN